MATIKDMENKMTLFYSKNTGEIKNYCTGIQDMGYYGKDKDDYSLIWTYTIVELDEYIITNINNFVIEQGLVKLKRKGKRIFNIR